MRSLVVLVLGGAVLAGCFVDVGGGGPDPRRPQDLDACPDGVPHLLVGLQSTSSIFDDDPAEQVVLRFTPDFDGCRGLVVPSSEYGEIYSVGGLPDGSDLVGFDGNRFSALPGAVVRFRGQDEVDRVQDPSLLPIAARPITFGGAPAVAILWGHQGGSGVVNDRLDVVAREQLTQVLGSWTVPRDLLAIGPALTDGDRLSGLVQWDGLQGYRIDAGAETLSTTGELQVPLPPAGTTHAMDVHGGVAQIATHDGVSFWTSGASPAFVGPRYCRHATRVGGALPMENADYVDVAIDLATPSEAALALVYGSLDVASTSTHVFRLQRRGECERVYTVPEPYRGQAIAWSGRP
ncbi:MAG: hypothetical protein H6719_07615 [Sandaracinaceae bacterium]|nr:hypothetical protein [Sandaracinaceae bacterium]